MTIPIAPPTLNVFNIQENAETPNHKHQLYEKLSAVFVVPAVGSQASIVVELASQYTTGMWLWIDGAGTFLITGVTDATHILVKNTGAILNQAAGYSVPIGTITTPCIEQSEADETPDVVLYDTLSQVFTCPAAGASASMYVTNCADWAEIGIEIYLDGAGFYVITALDSVTSRITVENLDDENPAGGTTVAVNTALYPCPPPRSPTTLTGIADDLDPTANTNDENLGSVVFGTAFASIPVVTLGYEPGGALGALLVVMARNITVNGFDIYSCSGNINDVNIDVHWNASIERN